MQHESQLHAKVAARNNVHRRLRANAQAFFDAIRPFVGKKIKTTNGDFTQAFRNAIAPLTSAPNGEYWNRSDYSLSRVFKVSENGPRSCAYAEATLYIGDIDGQTLKDLSYADKFDATQFRMDYTASAVVEGRAKVKQAREALQRAERELSYFGEHDAH